MGRRKPGKYPFDYTAGDDRRFLDSGVGGTVRVLHGPGRGMGMTEGVVCRVEVTTADDGVLDVSHAGKLGKEHRLRGTAPGDRIGVEVTGRFDGDDCDCGSADCAPVLDELTSACVVQLTGDLDDVVRFGVGPAWAKVEAIDAGEYDDAVPTACHWGAGVRIRGGTLAL
ncbi:hypothetical protein [Blastococcus sp. PRF04-17]|uniref:hypothetical protein n=1 Tax=Blastococcus sp. PRF04-17 TaxID=2933797 RepID=UPI001FF3BAD9|nr:hypothetical protein [Blastococcus sp. PRF04-17]UOY01893.1 hypothetical protein MVA48_00455 [Blastococcus sp. PRF04-17]